MDFIKLMSESLELIDYIDDKTKEWDPAAFLAFIGSSVDKYARNHDLPPMALHELLYETAGAIHKEAEELKEAN